MDDAVVAAFHQAGCAHQLHAAQSHACLLYTSDAADERSSVDLGGRRIIKKKKNKELDSREIMKNKKT